MKVKNLFANVISPPVCMACGEELPVTASEHFCYSCSKSFKKIKSNVCSICGKPLGENASMCRYCRTERFYYDKVVSRYKYTGCVADAIRNMKFRNKIWIAFELGKMICETIYREYSDIAFDMVIYVPMTGLAEMNRGFNQAREIADIVSRTLGIPIVHNVLYKNLNVKTQSGLNRRERFLNMRNAFYIPNPEAVTDKAVLLIDDVHTTGATLNACARALKGAGAVAVYCATVATTVEDE